MILNIGKPAGIGIEEENNKIRIVGYFPFNLNLKPNLKKNIYLYKPARFAGIL